MSLNVTSPTANSTVSRSFAAQGTVTQGFAPITGRINGKTARNVATSNGNWILSFTDVPDGVYTLSIQGDGKLDQIQNITVSDAPAPFAPP